MINAGAHERALLNKLLSNYNTLERPVENETEPLQVKFGITLQQIIDVVSTDDCYFFLFLFVFFCFFFFFKKKNSKKKPYLLPRGAFRGLNN